MKKLLVAPKHDPRPFRNGTDGCYGRWVGGRDGGCCPGARTAEWLNGLGDDDAPYGRSPTIKNIDVRLNWLKGCDHIVAKDPEVARLREIERRAAKDLADARARLDALGEDPPCAQC